jgi:tRNA nucleotidyltransferase (CCA-adding enzyme)
MHVILTHEQADFDALAALMAAHLINEQAVPVLPRRLNRNVRAFLNLYGAELPFLDPRDLPPENIDAVTLVDTQSLVTLKGMTHKATVHVVDHHQIREDIPDKWTMVNQRVGATTTILTEEIRDHNGPLTLLQATLLLMGIYEDTGSLTYASTTTRDVRAVAFLLEQGASLRIAADYLNPPLSEDQRDIYNKLLQSAETLHIHGQNIVIASTDAEELNEEISSIAHKLRDLLDPDGLFLLVNTSEGVRLVARSTSDRVNVAEIASRMGGGGHERAAAALMRTADDMNGKPVTLANAYLKLVSLLPIIIEPPVTVGKIMSRGPRVLPPETSAQDAALLMQRYGYEGYPIVKDGKVLGLLTRRAVDRAVTHKLNLPAASLMEAGEVTVFPQDSLDSLQKTMAETGWGQIPVKDPESGEIIGIVTRTDLLKSMGEGETILPERKNLAARLEAALPPARLSFLKLIAEMAREKHLPVYIVGGFVRDLLLERPSIDFDLVVEGDAIALARSLERKYGGRVATHTRFGTAKWQIDSIREDLLGKVSGDQKLDSTNLPESLDLISARTEFYNYPSALPTVERGSIKLDLHRRDFTINTLALRLDGRHYGNLYDYWGGLIDLQKGWVRVLHSLSFVDDPTRMLRAVRFEQRFNFQIEARTLELMNEAHELLKQVSGDRLRHEFDLIFIEENAAPVLNRLEALGLLSAIHPTLHWQPQLADALTEVLRGSVNDIWELDETIGNIPLRRGLAYLVWLISHPGDAGSQIAHRLRLSHQMRAAIQGGSQLIAELPKLIKLPASRIVARLDALPLSLLYAVYCLKLSDSICKTLEMYVSNWRKIHPTVNGYDLHALGMAPGPAYRQILWALRAAWLDGKITTPDQENALLQQMVHTQSI